MFDGLTLHDLKNPLTGITVSVGLFLDGLLGEVSAEQKKYLENIDFSARRLTLLLGELTFINNIKNNGYQPARTNFSAAALARDLAWLKRLAARENKAVRETIDGDLTLLADRELTLLMLTDLLLNAVRQTPGGGTAALNIGRASGRAVIEVSDGGDGIAREHLARVFDEDWRAAHPQLKALTSPGAGFYFCRLAAEAQGGRIEAQCPDGQGLKLILTLPLK